MTQTTFPATDKQLAFIDKLRGERYELTIAEKLALRAADATLSKSEASKLIDGLLKTPKLAVAPAAAAAAVAAAAPVVPTVVLATEKQVAFMNKLLAERPTLAAAFPHPEALTKTEASKLIDAWIKTPKEAPVVDPYVATAAKKGDVHVVDGEYYRIHVKQTNGKPYAARATIWSKAVWDDEGKLVKAGHVTWARAKGVKLSDDTKATAAEAHAFGKMIGRCCFCSTKIDTPESVTAGYGPICAANKGLPWGEVAMEIQAMTES